jgi:hypothetical protein
MRVFAAKAVCSGNIFFLNYQEKIIAVSYRCVLGKSAEMFGAGLRKPFSSTRQIGSKHLQIGGIMFYPTFRVQALVRQRLVIVLVTSVQTRPHRIFLKQSGGNLKTCQ